MPARLLPVLLPVFSAVLLTTAGRPAAADGPEPTPQQFQRVAREQFLHQACIRRMGAQEPRFRRIYEQWRAERRAWFERFEHSEGYQIALIDAREYAREFYDTRYTPTQEFDALCLSLLPEAKPAPTPAAAP